MKLFLNKLHFPIIPEYLQLEALGVNRRTRSDDAPETNGTRISVYPSPSYYRSGSARG
jgi:hypothetical protein